jgi:hypothetical protein
MYMHVEWARFYNIIAHIFLFLKTKVHITSILNCLFGVQVQGYVNVHTIKFYSIYIYACDILFYNTVLYHVEFCSFSTCTYLSFDIYISYQFVVYSVMVVCLYAELKLVLCTCTQEVLMTEIRKVEPVVVCLAKYILTNRF